MAGIAPRGVRIISVVHILLAGFWGLIALFCASAALSGGMSGGVIAISSGAFVVAALVCAGISGGLAAMCYGLFEGKNWARGAAIVLSSMAVLAGLGGGAWLDLASGVLLDGLWGSSWVSVAVHSGVVAYLALSEDVARYFR